MALAILSTHPIQYYAPLFREIARRVEITVFFAHRATPAQQAAAGFGKAFDWDIDLTTGYSHEFLRNVAREPGAHHFAGCDTPEIDQKISGRFDALLVTGWNSKCYWQGVWAAKCRGIPVMVRGDSHLDTPRGLAKRLVKSMTYPALLRLFDAALYVGERNKAYYLHYRYPAKRLFHSPHCVDIERFKAGATPAARAALRARLGIDPDEKAILFAGKLISFKRPLDVIAAAAVVRAQGLRAHVIVAGSGPLEQEMRSIAQTVDVPLHVLGFQNQTQMPAAYAAADVLALPSRGEETWGLVCNEALACGRPVVVSDSCGCAPDLTGDSTVGRTFAVGDVAALAQALTEVLCSPPSSDALALKSAAYSAYAAADGVQRAHSYLLDQQCSSTSFERVS